MDTDDIVNDGKDVGTDIAKLISKDARCKASGLDHMSMKTDGNPLSSTGVEPPSLLQHIRNACIRIWQWFRYYVG